MRKGNPHRLAPVEDMRRRISELSPKPYEPLGRIKYDLAGTQRKSAQSGLLPSSRIFDPDGCFLKYNLDKQDRIILVRRIRTFVFSRRRGKLRLPQHFSDEVLRLTELPKWRLKQMCRGWVKPDHGIGCRVDDATFDQIARNFPGIIWNAPKSLLGHMANLVGTRRLGKQAWPRISRPAWPSTPTFTEMLEMSRQGRSVPGLDRNRITVRNCMTTRQVSDDIRLANGIVNHNIIGIRSAVEVPRQFLDYFRYRHGFLILTNAKRAPAALVRFLIGQWVRCPFNLWLKENCRFKIFLKRHTPSDVVGEVVGRKLRVVDLGDFQLGSGKTHQISMIAPIIDFWVACDEPGQTRVRRSPYRLIDKMGTPFTVRSLSPKRKGRRVFDF